MKHKKMFEPLKLNIVFKMANIIYASLLPIQDSSNDTELKSFMEWCININELDTPAGNYLLKVNNRNTNTMCEIC